MKYYSFRFSGVAATLFTPDTLTESFAILLGGFPPGQPATTYHPFIEELISRNVCVLAPTYLGIKDSNGEFSMQNAVETAKKSIEFIRSGTGEELWANTHLNWKCNKLVLIGTSYGGSVALYAGATQEIDAILAISAVVDWNAPLHESTSQVEHIVKRMYPHTIRLAQNWNDTNDFNPIHQLDQLKGNNITLVHSKDDPVVPFEQSVLCAEKTGATLITLENAGHAGTSDIPTNALDNIF